MCEVYKKIKKLGTTVHYETDKDLNPFRQITLEIDQFKFNVFPSGKVILVKGALSIEDLKAAESLLKKLIKQI